MNTVTPTPKTSQNAVTSVTQMAETTENIVTYVTLIAETPRNAKNGNLDCSNTAKRDENDDPNC